ncbi:hypothetical protein OEW28_18495 [Defluviimonas sp. WL0002]|uniref:Roadblock/LAMTOR2 domain-containing protein n=1 Tax=Albidovulum marisflavi TaxID=2984159 RepID=A0ABT2ZHM1_9RHOB|nr:hypothetical protein [Defluviimonas sp. WL0002]MCV2870606.1 hypothetical protein [Defluviimonas sp. WL0002]
MALNGLMDGTLQALPDCLAVCYVDMPEELVLTRRSSRAFSQEILDAIATLAARLLDGQGMAGAWRAAVAASAEAMPGEALIRNKDFTCLFLRMEKHGEHALCLIGKSGADVAQMRNAGRQLGKDIANVL